MHFYLMKVKDRYCFNPIVFMFQVNKGKEWGLELYLVKIETAVNKNVTAIKTN